MRLTDENPTIVNSAFVCLSDILKITSKKELGKFIDDNVNKAEKSKDIDEKTIAVYSLMGVLLAFPYEISEWTEKVLKIVLKNRKMTKTSLDKVKDFCAKFWKNKDMRMETDEYKLSEEIIQSLSEVANPYNYFA